MLVEQFSGTMQNLEDEVVTYNGHLEEITKVNTTVCGEVVAGSTTLKRSYRVPFYPPGETMQIAQIDLECRYVPAGTNPTLTCAHARQQLSAKLRAPPGPAHPPRTRNCLRSLC